MPTVRRTDVRAQACHAVAAADAARLSVMSLEREGGQAEFIVHDQPPTPRGSALEPLLRWMENNTGTDLTLDGIATHAGMSTALSIATSANTPVQHLCNGCTALESARRSTY